MDLKKIEKYLGYLNKNLIKIAKKCNVKIDKDVAEAKSQAENDYMELAATVIDMEYQRCMEVIEDV